jgi:hypothetical protein
MFAYFRPNKKASKKAIVLRERKRSILVTGTHESQSVSNYPGIALGGYD